MSSNIFRVFILLYLFSYSQKTSGQGKWQIGAQGNYFKRSENFYSYSSKNETNRSFRNVGIGLFGSYALNSMFSLGLTYGFRKEHITDNFIIGSRLYDRRDLYTYSIQSASLLCRAQIPLAKKFGLNTDLQLAYAGSNNASLTGIWSSEDIKFYQLAIMLTPRFYYAINNSLSLDLNLGRVLYKVKEEKIFENKTLKDSSVDWDFDMGLQLGVYYRFGKDK